MSKTIRPVTIAKANVTTAIDQASEYANLLEALDVYFENLRDTLVELGADEVQTVTAEEAYMRFASAYVADWQYCMSAD